jgi:hypothetical protein
MIIEFDKSFSKSLDKLKDSEVKKRIESIILSFDKAEIITDIKNWLALKPITELELAIID